MQVWYRVPNPAWTWSKGDGICVHLGLDFGEIVLMGNAKE